MDNNSNDRILTNNKINEQDVSVYAYDMALVQDLKARFKSSVVKNNNINQTVQIGPTDQMFDIIGTLNEDNVILPFVSLQRLDWQLNLDRQRIPNFHW